MCVMRERERGLEERGEGSWSVNINSIVVSCNISGTTLPFWMIFGMMKIHHERNTKIGISGAALPFFNGSYYGEVKLVGQLSVIISLSAQSISVTQPSQLVSQSFSLLVITQ